MKKVTLAVLLLLSAFAWSEANPKPAEYTINVHVNKSYYGPHGEQTLNVVIDGKKYELSAGPDGTLLALGDYKAKLLKDEHKRTYSIVQVYEFLFPDQRTRKFWLSGQTE